MKELRSKARPALQGISFLLLLVAALSAEVLSMVICCGLASAILLAVSYHM